MIWTVFRLIGRHWKFVAAAVYVVAIIAWGEWRAWSGYADGQRDLLASIEKARAASIEEKDKIDEEIADLSDDDLLRRALGIVRNPSR